MTLSQFWSSDEQTTLNQTTQRGLRKKIFIYQELIMFEMVDNNDYLWI